MREFVAQVNKKLNARADLTEKDFLLHTILLDLSMTNFSENFAFKGGTCLIKHYLGYYRFSVDLDFTFVNQDVFRSLSQKKIRKILSEKIDEIGTLFEKIASKRGLDFKCEKGNERYVEFGGGSKFLTFKLWWNSPFVGETFIKIQINFIERILFPIKKEKLTSPLKEYKELEFLFPSFYKEYRKALSLNIYDIKEIFCEKIRAILTRKGIKERDFIDIYLISKKFGFGYEDFETEILEKTTFMLNLYTKYKTNLEENLKVLSVDSFPFGSENYLLLTEINREEFYKFVKEFITYLKKIGDRINPSK